MSRADIVQVTTLAAHLAQKGVAHGTEWAPRDAHVCAADAMLLQKLGRSIRNVYAKPSSVRRTATLRLLGLRAAEICEPYGLLSGPWYGPQGVYISGLPGNALGGNAEGFQI